MEIFDSIQDSIQDSVMEFVENQIHINEKLMPTEETQLKLALDLSV